jgi:hypothetical protein
VCKFSVRREKIGKITLLVLILIAAVLRFYRLDAQDIWGDEAFSIFLSQQPLPAVISGAADTHPPFYPLLLFIWLKLVGTDALSTRALSVLVGILVVPLIFVFAKRLVPTRPRVAWLAAILATVSPLLIYYSQETRMYELVTLLALASVYFATPTPDPSPVQRGRGWGRGYLLSTTFALYTHYSAFFVWFAENLFTAIYFRRTRAALTRWVLLQLALIAAYVPWIVVQSAFLRGKASTRFDEWGWRGIEMVVAKTVLAFSVGLTVDSPIAQIATMAFLIFVALGAYGILRARNAVLWLAPIYFVVPVFVAWVINPVMPFFWERYVLVALPGFYVTTALGLDDLARRSTRVGVGVTGGLVLVSAFSLSNYFFNDAYVKGKYGQMMAYVASHAQLGDALILNNPLQKPLFDYYRPRGVPAFYLPDGAPLEDPRTRQQLADIARDHSRLWLVMFGNPAEYDPTGYLERWLGAHAFKSFSRGFVDARLSLYVMPSAQAPAVQRSLQATLGEHIWLMGYDLDRTEIRPGQTLQLTLHWQVTAQIVKPYTVFTHLIGATNPATKSPVWAQMDGEPVGGSRPTTGWQVGETINDRYGLRIPQNIPLGDYTLEVGMYDPVTRVRLPVRDGNGSRVADDRVVLGTVSVNAR